LIAYSRASSSACIYYYSLALVKAAFSAARSACALDLLNAFYLKTCSPLSSASTRDLAMAASVAARETASSAYNLDLLNAFSASNSEIYL